MKDGRKNTTYFGIGEEAKPRESTERGSTKGKADCY